MRHLLLSFLLLNVLALPAQDKLEITGAKALGNAPDVRKAKGVEQALQAAGLTAEQQDLVLKYGDRSCWPEGIASDTARAANAPYIINYSCFKVCDVRKDTVQNVLVMVPARENLQMPENMRPVFDFFLILPARALKVSGRFEARPLISAGPAWQGLPRAKIIQPDGLYATYDLGRDSTALQAFAAAGMTKEEIARVVFRAREHNWPKGIDHFGARYPHIRKFRKYRAYFGAGWDDKVLLIVSAAKNRRMRRAMRPKADLYFVYKASAVKVRGK